MIRLLITLMIYVGLFRAGYAYKSWKIRSQVEQLENIDWSKVKSIERGGVRFERVSGVLEEGH